jgi:hypothetical protein
MLLHTGEADISTRQQRTRKAAKSKAAAELIAGIKLYVLAQPFGIDPHGPHTIFAPWASLNRHIGTTDVEIGPSADPRGKYTSAPRAIQTAYGT